VALLLRIKVPEESVSMLAPRVSAAPLRRRAAATALGLVGFALGGLGCTSRTLPLPPPDVDPLAAPNTQGLVMVRGTAHGGASVGVLNERSQLGVIGTADNNDCDSACPFEIEIPAKSGDPIRVWQFFTTPSSRDLKVPK
jgi:hypothetical protein